MAFLTTQDGRKLSYEKQGEGKPLVCHPGGPGIPGPPLNDAYALEDYVSDLAHLQEHLGLDRIVPCAPLLGRAAHRPV